MLYPSTSLQPSAAPHDPTALARQRSLQLPEGVSSEDASAQPAPPSDADPRRSSAEPEKILVVDDDLALRGFTVQALLRAGYEVVSSPDGEEAWRLLRSGFFHLLITDHDMPRMTGLELIGKARIARMTLPVILVSGGLHRLDPGADQLLRIAWRIAKPFSMQELLTAVRSALGVSRCNRAGRPNRCEQEPPSPEHGWGINE